MFRLLGAIKNHDLRDTAEHSLHLGEREARTNIYKGTADAGDLFRSFVVDTGHKNGLERHVIMTGGLLYIYNLKTDRLVTLFRPSKGQLFRYFKGTYVPKAIHEMALNNTKLNSAQGTTTMYKEEG